MSSNSTLWKGVNFVVKIDQDPPPFFSPIPIFTFHGYRKCLETEVLLGIRECKIQQHSKPSNPNFLNKNNLNAHVVTPQTPSSATTTTTTSHSHAIFARIAEGIGPKEVLLETSQLVAEAGRTQNDHPATPNALHHPHYHQFPLQHRLHQLQSLTQRGFTPARLIEAKGCWTLVEVSVPFWHQLVILGAFWRVWIQGDQV